MTLTDLLKTMTGRKLSQQQLERTRKGTITGWRFGVSLHRTEHTTSQELPQIRRQKYVWQTTQDVSYPHIDHTGYYHDRTLTRTYTKDGLLMEETEETGSIYTEPGRFVKRAYNPPGSWRGRKVESR